MMNMNKSHAFYIVPCAYVEILEEFFSSNIEINNRAVGSMGKKENKFKMQIEIERTRRRTERRKKIKIHEILHTTFACKYYFIHYMYFIFLSRV